MMEKKFTDIAITLARMYGVAEILNPLPSTPTENFAALIYEWTVEYMKSEKKDIVHFFEHKIAK